VIKLLKLKTKIYKIIKAQETTLIMIPELNLEQVKNKSEIGEKKSEKRKMRQNTTENSNKLEELLKSKLRFGS